MHDMANQLTIYLRRMQTTRERIGFMITKSFNDQIMGIPQIAMANA